MTHNGERMPQTMKQFLAAPILILGLANAAIADFGSADVTTSSSFDAYCGKRGNKCKIDFDSTNITVDKKSKVGARQIIGYSNFAEYDGKSCWPSSTPSCMVAAYDYIINIDYVKKDGARSAAKVIFVNKNSYTDFLSAMKAFTGMGSSGEIDPRCPNGGRLMAGSCLDESQRAAKVQQDIQTLFRTSDGFSRMEDQRIERERLDIERQRVEVEAIDAMTPDTVIDVEQNNLQQNNLFY